MRFGPVPLAEAEGAILAHGQSVGNRRWAKGRRLSDEDITEASAAGIAELTVARLENGDVSEDEAAARLAAALTGYGVAADAAVHGRCNLRAEAAGLLIVDAALVSALNRVDESITLGSLAAHARVSRGDIVATVKIIPYAVDTERLETALSSVAPLAVAPFRAFDAAIVHTALGSSLAKVREKTGRITTQRVEALGGEVIAETDCPHEIAALGEELRRATASLILVAAASATVDRRDVVPAAIEAAGGVVERVGMPVDPGNLLCLGRIGDRAVIGLPGCARSPKRNGVDLVLERLAAGLQLDSEAIAAMGAGGLLADADRPDPRVRPARTATIGAIVLAAGRSTRMGSGAHKLLADVGGQPLAAHALDAIARAGLPPPVVVLGHRAEDVRAALGNRAATWIVAPDFAEGLSRSLRAGIAAVPCEWAATFVCLADMPRVDPATLRTLAAVFAGQRTIAVPVFGGKRGNPVLWGRAHFARLASVEGDVGGKAVLGDAEDDVIEVPVDDPGIFADVDTPEALAAIGGTVRDALSDGVR